MKKWECTVCGYIHEGDEPPEECPVCAADKSMFVEVTEEQTPAPATPEAKDTEMQPSSPARSNLLDILTTQILKHHLHPITVHTPNGVVPMAVLFLCCTAFLGWPLFETAAFYSLIFVLISMPAVVYTGITVWQHRYRGAMTNIFRVKIIGSAATATLLLILTIWRAVEPGIVTAQGGRRWVFLLLTFCLLAAVGITGHMGGKLVFGSRKQ